MYNVELKQGYKSLELKYNSSDDVAELLADLHQGKPTGEFEIVITFEYGKDGE